MCGLSSELVLGQSKRSIAAACLSVTFNSLFLTAHV